MELTLRSALEMMRLGRVEDVAMKKKREKSARNRVCLALIEASIAVDAETANKDSLSLSLWLLATKSKTELMRNTEREKWLVLGQLFRPNFFLSSLTFGPIVSLSCEKNS